MIVKLTARTVASLKAVPGERVEYHDADLPGLALRVTERGAKSWTVVYRHRDRLRRLTLGSADVLTLAKARDRARDALEAARGGADPASTKQEARRADTIADLAADYIERYAKRRKRSWREDQRMLRAYILPAWKHRAIRDIARRDIRTLVDDIAENGSPRKKKKDRGPAPIQANRVTSLISKLFKFALDHDLIETSPAVAITRPAPEQKRARVLADDEIRRLWQAFEALAPEMAAFYKLRLITAQRGGEVASMKWQDVDLDSGWWTIPAAVAKNKLAHRVPLSASALTLLKALREHANDSAVYVLAGARGRRQQSEAAATLTVPDFRGHDLRRTAASLMTGGGIPRLVVGKILNHVEPGVTAVYDRHSYDAEKRAALDWWSLKLTAILENKPAKMLAFAATK